jgi:hypothetical protein
VQADQAAGRQTGKSFQELTSTAFADLGSKSGRRNDLKSAPGFTLRLYFRTVMDRLIMPAPGA